MKKHGILIALFLSVFMFVSCHKDDADNIADCITEGFLLSIHHSADSQNPRLINFTINYAGEYTLNNSVTWNFGDGQTATVTGMTASHTYTASGTFPVKATVKLNGTDCSLDVHKSVNIQ